MTKRYWGLLVPPAILIGVFWTSLVNADGTEPPLPDFQQFLQISQDNYRAIRSGEFAIRFEQATSSPLGFKSQRQRLIEAKDEIQRKHGLTDKQKKDALDTLDHIIKQNESSGTEVPQQSQAMDRKYVFDLPSHKYRLDEAPVPGIAALNAARTVVMENGSQIRLYPTDRTAVIDHFSQNEATDLPVYLGVLDPRGFSTSPEKATVSRKSDGKLLYELQYGNGTTMRITADPAIGLRYRSIEYVSIAGNVVRRVEADEFKLVDGIPFPMKYAETYYEGGVSQTNSTQTTTSYAIRVQTAHFNHDVASSAFELQMPVDVNVTDAKLGITYKLSAIPESASAARTRTLDSVLKQSLNERLTVEKSAASKSTTNTTASNDSDSGIDPTVTDATASNISTEQQASWRTPLTYGSLCVLAVVLIIAVVKKRQSDQSKAK